MATIEQIQVFTAFAVQLSAQEGEGISLDEIYDRWREKTLRPTDASAVQASLRDMDQGETGRPFDEFAEEFRSRNNVGR